MDANELVADGFDRVHGAVIDAVTGLTPQQLAARPDPDANSIGWLVWHLSRVMDGHLAPAFDTEQLWVSQGWYDAFDLPFPPEDDGYGHSSEDVAAVRADGDQLLAYFEAVYTRTTGLLALPEAQDLDRFITLPDGLPVPFGMRVAATLVDVSQHTGQAAYVRGLIERGV